MHVWRNRCISREMAWKRTVQWPPWPLCPIARFIAANILTRSPHCHCRFESSKECLSFAREKKVEESRRKRKDWDGGEKKLRIAFVFRWIEGWMERKKWEWRVVNNSGNFDENSDGKFFEVSSNRFREIERSNILSLWSVISLRFIQSF